MYDGSGETEAIEVVFRCYTNDGDGSYTAWFGYNNANGHNVYVTDSNENYVSGGISSVVPSTQFRPGMTEYGLSVK